MMTGTGQFGGIDMGGMFTTLKLRDGLARTDYKDPGAYQHPKGSVAREYDGTDKVPEVKRPPVKDEAQVVEVQVRKPNGHGEHSGH
jgi:hypothetical protein